MPGSFYLPVYLTVISLLTCVQYTYYKRSNYGFLASRRVVDPVNSFLFAVLVSVFIGLRPQYWGFVDMNNYIDWYPVMWGYEFSFDWNAENFLFDNLYSFMSCSGIHWHYFFLVIAFIYFGCMWYSCWKLFPYDTQVAFLTCLAAFSTFSYGTNGVKAGAAASLFLTALSYRRNLLMTTLFLFLSLGFHHSMMLPIGAFILAYFYRNTKVYFLVWGLCLLMAAAHITYFQTLLAGFSDERGTDYLLSVGNDWGGKTGFRIDFIIYSAMPILVGYWAIFRRGVRSMFYEFVLSVYLITNAIWLLCMYASFTNRIAYLSWSMYPIVLIYPFLNENFGKDRYKQFAKVTLFHLLFTLFMEIVYY